MDRSVAQLYRDCLRLAKHIGGRSKKGQAITQLIKLEFEKGKTETDSMRTEVLKSNAVKALSNYLLYAHSMKDSRFNSSTDKEPSGNQATR